MLKDKLIKTRKEKKFSQHDLAKHLNISQTQYLRKEKGDIKISDEEWERIANLMDVEVDEIKQNDDGRVFNNFENITKSYIGNNNTYFVPEFLLENQKDYIELLKKEITQLREKISKLENQ